MTSKNLFIKVGVLSALSLGGFVQADESTGGKIPVPVSANVVKSVDKPFTILHQDSFKVSAADSQKKAIVISTAEEYEQVLAQYTTDAPAEVDFSIHKVLLIESGSQPNSGFGVKVNGIIEHSDRVVAHVSHVTPDNNPACSYMAVMTQPYLFAKVATSKPLLVREHTEVQPCITGGLSDL